MNEVLTKFEQISPYLWENLIQSSDTATFFQTKDCYEFYSSLSFMEPFVFAVKEEKKLLALVVGYILADGNRFKQFFSRRAIVPGGMLIHPDATDMDVQTLLLTLNNSLRKKAIYVEFRNYTSFTTYKQAFSTANYEYHKHLNFHVDTSTAELAQSKMTSTKLRDVKASFKNGAKVVIGNSLDEVVAYYSILENLYATKVKTPLFPLSFFQHLLHTSFGVFILVKLNEEIIGGSVCVKLPGKSLYEWFVCGLDGDFKGVFPSTLATWASIEYAANFGMSRFDMMGAGKPEEGYGVRNFKSKFGGELVEHGRFLHVNNVFLYGIGKRIVEFLKKRK